MHTFLVLYNRLAEQHRGPSVDYLTGDDPKVCLREFFHYTFRRVVGEEGKSPDIILRRVGDDRLYTYKFIAVKKASEVKHENCPKEKDPITHRYVKRKT